MNTSIDYVSDCFARGQSHVRGNIRFHRIQDPYITVDQPLQISCHLPEVVGSTGIGIKNEIGQYALNQQMNQNITMTIQLYDTNMTAFG